MIRNQVLFKNLMKSPSRTAQGESSFLVPLVKGIGIPRKDTRGQKFFTELTCENVVHILKIVSVH